MRKRSDRAVLAAVLAALCAQGACAGEGGPASVVTDSAGITVVVNDPAQPVWGRDDGWRLAATPAVQVGNVPGDPGHQLYGVKHSRRMRDGGILVANTGLGDVRIFDGSGTPLRTYPLPANLS